MTTVYVHPPTGEPYVDDPNDKSVLGQLIRSAEPYLKAGAKPPRILEAAAAVAAWSTALAPIAGALDDACKACGQEMRMHDARNRCPPLPPTVPTAPSVPRVVAVLERIAAELAECRGEYRAETADAADDIARLREGIALLNAWAPS